MDFILTEDQQAMVASVRARLDQGLRANGTPAMAKRDATEACERELHGAMGITQELPLERMWRDARMFQVPAGTMGVLALIQGCEFTGVGAFR